jgi:hypothetical protein
MRMIEWKTSQTKIPKKTLFVFHCYNQRVTSMKEVKFIFVF